MTQESQKHLPRYKIGCQSDEWGMGGSTPTGIPSPDGAWVCYEDAQAVAAGYAAARLEIESLQARLQEVGNAARESKLEAQLNAVVASAPAVDGGPAFPAEFSDGFWHGMTLREYAAIKLKIPESGTDWLDEMIRKGGAA